MTKKHFIDMNKSIKKYLAKIGAKGGKKSKRALTADQARTMVKAREAKKKPRAWPEEWLSMDEIKKRWPPS